VSTCLHCFLHHQSQLIRLEEEKERVEAEVGRHLTQLEMLQVGTEGGGVVGGVVRTRRDRGRGGQAGDMYSRWGTGAARGLM